MNVSMKKYVTPTMAPLGWFGLVYLVVLAAALLGLHWFFT